MEPVLDLVIPILMIFGLALALSYDKDDGFSSPMLMAGISIAFAVFTRLGYIDIYGYAIAVAIMVVSIYGGRE